MSREPSAPNPAAANSAVTEWTDELAQSMLDAVPAGTVVLDHSGTIMLVNRAWAEPTAATSPEVLAIRDAMDASGVDYCLDVHGDEAIPYTFVAGSEAIPSWTNKQAQQLSRIDDSLCRSGPLLLLHRTACRA